MLNKEAVDIIKSELEKGNKYFVHESQLNKRTLSSLKKVAGFKMEPANGYGHMVLSSDRLI